MGRKKKPWSVTITNDAAGLSVRVYERVAGGVLHRDVRQGDDSKDRKSLRHRDRERAQTQAKELLQRLQELRTAGRANRLSLGTLEMLYLKHKTPTFSPGRQRGVKGMMSLLLAHFGRDFVVTTLSQDDIDAYAHARQIGALKSKRHRVKGVGVRNGTIRNELDLFHAMTDWAQGRTIDDDRKLLVGDPFKGKTLPVEPNMRRPVATDERYQALLKVSHLADTKGRFRTVLVLSRHTGRRINAVVNLKTSDVLRTKDQMVAALAEAGDDLRRAEAWPSGAIRWRPETDKRRYLSIAPINKAARAELDQYLRDHPRVGDAPLFSATEEPGNAVHKELARYWLRRAEKLAKLPTIDRGGFHAFRRLWASERRHRPAQDVARVGGWRSIQVMRDAYQQSDAATEHDVVENSPKTEVGGHTADTPKTQSVEAQGL
jgi:integrase